MIGLCLVMLATSVAVDTAASERPAAPPCDGACATAHKQCRAEALRLFSMSPAEPRLDQPLKERRAVKWPGTLEFAGQWEGEALIAPDGTTQEVWIVRGFGGDKDTALVALLKDTEYEPLTIEGRKLPKCIGLRFSFRDAR